MNQTREKVNPIAKAAKDAVLAELCNSIRFKKNEQFSNKTGNIEYGYVAQQISGVNRVCSEITRNDVYNELRRQERIANQKKKLKFQLVQIMVICRKQRIPMALLFGKKVRVRLDLLM